MKSNPSNPCAGAFSDWLDVMLLKECNGKCSWCIEKDGYHPSSRVSVEELTKAIIDTGKKNIVLLGGEPTLYPDLAKLIYGLSEAKLNIYLTTNASKLTFVFAHDNYFEKLKGLNISVHHYDREINYDITGVKISHAYLKCAIKHLNQQGVNIRFNCNCFKGGIDTYEKAMEYINFAKDMGVNTVRFSEITGEDKIFVKLNDIFKDAGLPNCPFEFGCNHKMKISNINIIFRQMCGLQTSCRERPNNPEQKYTKNNVMYYDGKCYDGWLVNKANEGETEMPKSNYSLIESIIENLQSGIISKNVAVNMLETLVNSKSTTYITKEKEMPCHGSKRVQESCHGTPVRGHVDESCHGSKCH